MSPSAPAAVPVILQVSLRVARFLRASFGDAMRLLWFMALDLMVAGRIGWRWYRARRNPDGADRFGTWCASIRQRRKLRWAPWAAAPTGQRMASAAMAALLVLFAIRLLPARSSVASQPGPDSATFLEPAAIESEGAPTTPSLDVSAAAARMRSDISGAARGQWVFLPEGPVLAPGRSAAWNGFHTASPAVVRSGTGGYDLWYRGCRLHGRAHDCAIGHATSHDGLEWALDPGPSIVPLEGANAFQLGGIAVVRANGSYFLWYSVTASRFHQRPTSSLFLATSSDGVRWTQHGRVLTATEQLPRFIEPSAVHDGSQFHLWFVDSLTIFEGTERNAPADGPFLRHLVSPDGRTWQEAARFPLGLIERGRVHISVTRDPGGSYRAFYFGHLPDLTPAVGWLFSADGNAWRLRSTVPLDLRQLGDDVQGVPYGTGLPDERGVRMWFVTERAGGRQEIRAAFYRE